MTNAVANAACQSYVNCVDHALETYGVEPAIRSIVAGCITADQLADVYGEDVRKLYRSTRPSPAFPTLAKQRPPLIQQMQDLLVRHRLALQFEIALATLNLTDEVRVELIRGLNRLQVGRSLGQKQKVAWQAVRAVIDMI